MDQKKKKTNSNVEEELITLQTYLLQRGVLVEAAVFEIYLVVAGRVNVMSVNLQVNEISELINKP